MNNLKHWQYGRKKEVKRMKNRKEYRYESKRRKDGREKSSKTKKKEKYELNSIKPYENREGWN